MPWLEEKSARFFADEFKPPFYLFPMVRQARFIQCSKCCGRDAIIIEFKVLDPDEEEELADTVREALNQIEKKQYEAVLWARGIPSERIRKYGFAFCGKRVLIGKAG